VLLPALVFCQTEGLAGANNGRFGDCTLDFTDVQEDWCALRTLPMVVNDSTCKALMTGDGASDHRDPSVAARADLWVEPGL